MYCKSNYYVQNFNINWSFQKKEIIVKNYIQIKYKVNSKAELGWKERVITIRKNKF